MFRFINVRCLIFPTLSRKWSSYLVFLEIYVRVANFYLSKTKTYPFWDIWVFYQLRSKRSYDGDITLCDNKHFKQNFIKGIIFVFREICFHRADNQVKLSIINWFISNDKKCDKFKTLSKSCEFDCQFQDKNVLSLFSILSNSNKDPVLYFYIDHKIQTWYQIK